MSLSDFIDAIESPALKQIAGHWRDVRGARTMPSWSNIRPSAIASHLAIVWSYKYDPATDLFTGRLSGDRIVEIFGKNFRGLTLAEIQPAEAATRVFQLFKRVVAEPALQQFKGTVFNQLDRVGIGARILLPLSTDGVISDGLLGATEYRIRSTDPSSLKSVRDEELWLALKDA